MAEHHYFVMDHRAIADVDRAVVMESLGGQHPTPERLRSWRNFGAVLVRYESKGEGGNSCLTNPVVLGEVDEILRDNSNEQ